MACLVLEHAPKCLCFLWAKAQSVRKEHFGHVKKFLSLFGIFGCSGIRVVSIFLTLTKLAVYDTNKNEKYLSGERR